MTDSYQAERMMEEAVRTNNLLVEMLAVLKRIEQNQPNPLDRG